jgi:hypothetical protein
MKRVLLQAAACNLALILRSLIGAGTPKGFSDQKLNLFFALLCVLEARSAASKPLRIEDSSDRTTESHMASFAGHCQKRTI